MKINKELKVSLGLINEKLHFKGVSRKNEPISIDYIPPLGDNLGYTSLELFLFSISSCIASTILIFLRKENKIISTININASGIRKEEHPTGLRNVDINIEIDSQNLTNQEMESVIKKSKEEYCPVISMLNKDVQVAVNYEIIKERRHVE